MESGFCCWLSGYLRLEGHNLLSGSRGVCRWSDCFQSCCKMEEVKKQCQSQRTPLLQRNTLDLIQKIKTSTVKAGKTASQTGEPVGNTGFCSGETGGKCAARIFKDKHGSGIWGQLKNTCHAVSPPLRISSHPWPSAPPGSNGKEQKNFIIIIPFSRAFTSVTVLVVNLSWRIHSAYCHVHRKETRSLYNEILTSLPMMDANNTIKNNNNSKNTK